MEIRLPFFVIKLLSLLVTCQTSELTVNSSVSRPTPVDGLLFSMGRAEMNNLFNTAASKGSNFVPSQHQQYKCQILNALFMSAKAKYQDSLPEKVCMRLSKMLETCGKKDFRSTEVFNQPFIFPGTKFCGQGNIAENFHDLGIFNETDACCRDHDYCDDIIRAGRTKHNLINPYGTTRLHCKCDRALRNCFRRVNSVVSNTVGYIFFSLLQTQCYDLDHPITGCLNWKRGALRLYCVKYKKQDDKPKKWQWFDQEPFV